MDGNTTEAQINCLRECHTRQGATGCEVIWDQGNRGCYIHTQSVAKGNEADRHYCWIFSKCCKFDNNLEAKFSFSSFDNKCEFRSYLSKL